ncbi:MAG TPA: RES family NAD+ phosphorylase [Gemmatimonadales bacterium]|nr:RES family NAD+ phosphorylase [Gemmatimonadales bacterium]
MLTVWRIVKAKHAASAFDGEGARLSGGRWTSEGRRAVYTSSTIALATLEMLAHLDSSAPLTAYRVIEVKIPERLVREVESTDLPPQWRAYPAPPELRVIGDAWLEARQAAVLKVPSALVAVEYNYLINPEHADFPEITRGHPVPFPVDPRLR